MPDDWTQHLYSRLPEVYRLRDIEQGRLRAAGGDDEQALAVAPLLGLLRAVGDSVAAVHQDLEQLWDDFFIETCDDWVVPYLGRLLGTNLPANPIGQANRLDVRSTVSWRRTKGAPAMLRSLAAATTGWQVSLAEFFTQIAWVQNLDFQRAGRTLTPAVRDPFAMALLGRADDPSAHITDVRTSADLDRVRLAAGADGLAAPSRVAPGGWGTPGRYAPKHLGIFVGRLGTFRLRGVTPAPRPRPAPGPTRTWSFDPLGRDVPLFSAAARAPLDALTLERAPAAHFGPDADLCVRCDGVPLAMPRGGRPGVRASERDFGFGTPGPLVRLHPTEGMRLLDERVPREPGQHFVLRALWDSPGGERELGALRTLPPPTGVPAFRPGDALGPAGRLVLRIETATPDAAGWGDLPVADPGRFPAGVLAIRDDRLPRAARDGARPSREGHYENALLIALPEVFVWPGAPVELIVGEDGSTHTVELTPAGRRRGRVARASEGQAWPPAGSARASSTVATLPAGVHRREGLRVADPGRFQGFAGARIDVHLAGAAPLLVGGLTTVDLTVGESDRRRYALLDGDPVTWPAFRYLPSVDAARDRIEPGEGGVLVLSVGPADPAGLAGRPPQVVPQCELILTDRAGDALLVYLPELELTEATPEAWLVIADDGTSHRLPGEPIGLPATLRLPADATLARASSGQVMPVAGAYPLRRRVVVPGHPRAGELGVDVARGRFCLPSGDPLLGLTSRLTVDYVEGFPGPIGARSYDRGGSAAASRIVAVSGDAATDVPFFRIHRSISAALAAATDRDVIEIADSATYAERLTLDLSADRARGVLSALEVRAGRSPYLQRPCLDSRAASGGTDAILVKGMRGLTPQRAAQLANRAAVDGLLVAGGPVRLDAGHVGDVQLTGCSVSFAQPGGVSLLADADDADGRARCTLTRCTLGAVRTGAGLSRLVITDSVVDRRGGLAVGGPTEGNDLAGDDPAVHVQLERTTVLGRVRCAVLVASETILADAAAVDDRQAGCVRFSRFEPGSVLPRRYRCVPSADDAARGAAARPAFVSLRPANPGYAQLDTTSDPALLRASEVDDQVGAFGSTLPGLRLENLHRKLDEFLPVGLRALVIAET